MDPLLIGHAAVTCILCGLSWTVQGVHDPPFAAVGMDAFAQYEREHQSRIARLVGPAMVAELALTLALLAAPRGLLRAHWHRTTTWSLRAALSLWMIGTGEGRP